MKLSTEFNDRTCIDRVGADIAITHDRAGNPERQRHTAAIDHPIKDAWPHVSNGEHLLSRKVLDGIVRAEAHPELQLGLGLIQGAGQMQLVCGTDDELRAYLFGPPLEGRLRRPPRLDQVTVINLTDLIANIRRQAAKKKIDLGEPLFMTPDDPRYQELRRELLEIREADTKTVQKAAAFAALRERITSHVTIQ
jgi:hypothetical protein